MESEQMEGEAERDWIGFVVYIFLIGIGEPSPCLLRLVY